IDLYRFSGTHRTERSADPCESAASPGNLSKIGSTCSRLPPRQRRPSCALPKPGAAEALRSHDIGLAELLEQLGPLLSRHADATRRTSNESRTRRARRESIGRLGGNK